MTHYLNKIYPFVDHNIEYYIQTVFTMAYELNIKYNKQLIYYKMYDKL